MSVRHADVVVIGTGIAGLTAAHTLGKHHHVLLLTKRKLPESATQYAQGGIAAVMKDNDTPTLHAEDTLKAGDGLCDEAAVRLLVQEGPARVQELIALGANFDREGMTLHLTKEAAHSERRILHAKDRTGREIEKTLGRAVQNLAAVEILDETFVKSLILKEGRCCGVTYIRDDTIYNAYSKAVIIATGGGSQVYLRNTNPTVATGDGMILAYRAGAVLQDMEFVQFHPTTLFLGDKRPISMFLLSEALRGEGGILRNTAGHRFMPDVHPDAELAPRDIVSRAIFNELQATQSDCVYLDLSAISGDLSDRFPTIYNRCMQANIDMTRDLIPVAPAAHYMMGGIRTNDTGQTDVAGLYAAGEVAGLGLHGANRLASNSLLDGLVFGHRAALAVQDDINRLSMSAPTATPPNPGREMPIDKAKIRLYRQHIRDVMWQDVGIVRHKAGLKRALSALDRMQDIMTIQTRDSDVLECQNLYELACLITQSALEREESRGAHYRTDFPAKSQVWERHLCRQLNLVVR